MLNFKETLIMLSVLITIITGIIAIAVFSVKGFETERRELKIQSTALQNLTDAPKIQGFNINYEFYDRKIEKLWQLTLNCKNVGNEPVFGAGYKSNLQNNKLIIQFDTSFNLLAAQAINNEIQARVHIIDSQSVSIEFLKWQPDESLTLSLILEPHNKDSTSYPRIAFNDRELIDCSLSFHSSIDDFFIKHPITSIRKYFPDWSIRFLVSGSLGTAIVLLFPLIIILFVEIRKRILFYNWKKRYHERFLEKIDLLDDERKDYFKTNLKKTPDLIWSKIKIPQPPLPLNAFLLSFQLLIGVILFFVGLFNLIINLSVFYF